MYYLQSRYYDPWIGRFINADATWVLGVNQGSLLQFNLFTYCLNNPVMLTDHTGYIACNCGSGRVCTQNTGAEQSRVREPVSTTPMPTPEQTAAGMTMVLRGGAWILDVTVPVNNALAVTAAEAAAQGPLARWTWFLGQVNHFGPWDIKWEDQWNDTIAPYTFPGLGTPIRFRGRVMTPDRLGNWTYGYIGAAAGFALLTLQTGSWYAAGMPLWGANLDMERGDRPDIRSGFNAFR